MAAEPKEPGTDVAVLDDPAVVADVLTRVAAMPDKVGVEDPEAVQVDIIKRILASKGEEALAQRTPTKARDILGVALEVRGVRWMRSGIADNPLGLYALIDASRGDTGDDVLVTCGGQNVMAQLLVMVRDGVLPQVCKIVEAAETARGYRPLWLVKASAEG